MGDEVTSPLLPCVSLDDVIAFDEVLGFGTTYRLRKPIPCAALRREDPHPHFFETAGFDPADSCGSCLVVTRDAAPAAAPAAEPAGRLAKALAHAVVLADAEGGARRAARILDSALARTAAGDDAVARVEVLVYRAELATVLDDPATAA